LHSFLFAVHFIVVNLGPVKGFLKISDDVLPSGFFAADVFLLSSLKGRQPPIREAYPFSVNPG
jgi:hypothetical protein